MEKRCDCIAITNKLNRQETDSMVNNEEARFERNIHKIMTVPSRILTNAYFENILSKENTEADQVVQGLTTSRRGTRFKSVPENTFSRLITSKNLNLIDPEKYFSKIENIRIFKSAEDVSCIKLEDIKNNHQSCDLVKDIFDFGDHNSFASGFSSNKSVDKEGSDNVPYVGDLMKENEYDDNFLNDTANIGQTKEVINEEERYLSNIITVTFSPPTAEAGEAQTLLKSVHLSPKLPHNNASYCEVTLGLLCNDKDFLKMVGSQEEINVFISEMPLLTQLQKQEISNKVKEHFISLLGSSTSTFFLIKLFSGLSSKESISLISDLDLVSACMQPNYSSLVDLFKSLPTSDTEIIGQILNKFDSVQVWRQLIANKYGKNVVEFFIQSFLSFFVYKRKKLYELLETSLIEFSKKNYATFVIQVYLEREKSKSALKTIIDNLSDITSCRNGVFVVISATKVFEGDDLTQLLDKIISLSDSLSKNSYASTLVEYVFFNHTHYSAERFIKEKSDCFLGKLTFNLFQEIIEDNCGNYIIQKLINVVSPETKKELIDILQPLVSKIRKQSIKKKWEQIVTNQENSSINNSIRSCNNSSHHNSSSRVSGKSMIAKHGNSKATPKAFGSGIGNGKFLVPSNANPVQPIQNHLGNYQVPQYSLNMNAPVYGGFQQIPQNLGYPPMVHPNNFNQGYPPYSYPSFQPPTIQYSNYNTYYYNITSPQVNTSRGNGNSSNNK